MNVVYKKLLLLHLIKQKQQEMIKIGVKKGLCSEETIKYSMELDLLIIEYQKLQYQKRQKFS